MVIIKKKKSNAVKDVRTQGPVSTATEKANAALWKSMRKCLRKLKLE